MNTDPLPTEHQDEPSWHRYFSAATLATARRLLLQMPPPTISIAIIENDFCRAFISNISKGWFCEIHGTREDKSTLLTTCTCQEHIYCEHAALLLEYLDQHPDAEAYHRSQSPAYAAPRQVAPAENNQALPAALQQHLKQRSPVSNNYQRWLGQLSQTVAGPPPKRQQTGRQGVVYTWYYSQPQPWGREVAVEIGVARWLKSGRWGSAKELTYPNHPPPSVATTFSDSDRRLAAEWVALSNDVYGPARQAALNGISGSGDLLMAMVATDRARLADGTPLSSDTPRPATCAWQENEDGRWQVTVQVTDAQAVLTRPPLWLDCRRGLCGPLEGLSDQAVQALYQAPGIDPEALPAAHRLLAQLVPGLSAPEVTSSSPDIQPQAAMLILDTTITINAGSYAGAWARPGQALLPLAVYGEQLLPMGESQALVHYPDGSSGPRDLAWEQRQLHQLAALGLHRVSTHIQVRLEQARAGEAWSYVDLGGLTEQARERASSPESFPLAPEMLTRLLTSGWQRLGDDGAARVAQVVEVETWSAEVADGADDKWFDLSLGVHLHGHDEAVDVLPLLRQLAQLDEDSIHHLPRHGDPEDRKVLLGLDDERLLAMPLDEVLELYRAMLELFTRNEKNLRLSMWDFEVGERLASITGNWSGGKRLKQLHNDLKQLASGGFDQAQPSKGLQATLRPYQETGLAWLQTLRRMGLGGLLADDMGLGKTIQTLAFMLSEWENGRLSKPALVVAPVSTLGNWQRECARFTPDFKVLLHHGPTRRSGNLDSDHYHLVLTSYATLYRDRKHFQSREWSLVVCDEAQALKNPAAQQGQAIRKLSCDNRLALTGTPLENHLGELWALMHWVEPGLLGSQAVFDRCFRTPIEKQGDGDRARMLARRIAPVLLRRTKDAVLDDLPECTNLVHRLELGKQQATLYESIRAAMDDQVRSAIAAKGLARSKLEFLEALLRLRQTCCHPPLVPTHSARNCHESAKLDFLRDLLPELVDEGRRILLFSQFTGLLDHIDTLCEELQLTRTRLDGRTRNRQSAIDRFQTGEVPLFLISLKAGGMGLNLTAADTVILSDPWWNPAAEQQAIDRAHRIGQKNPVFVHRLIISGSVEERVLELQDRKRDLAAGLYDDSGQSLGQISDEDVASLLKPLS